MRPNFKNREIDDIREPNFGGCKLDDPYDYLLVIRIDDTHNRLLVIEG